MLHSCGGCGLFRLNVGVVVFLFSSSIKDTPPLLGRSRRLTRPVWWTALALSALARSAPVPAPSGGQAGPQGPDRGGGFLHAHVLCLKPRTRVPRVPRSPAPVVPVLAPLHVPPCGSRLTQHTCTGTLSSSDLRREPPTSTHMNHKTGDF